MLPKMGFGFELLFVLLPAVIYTAHAQSTNHFFRKDYTFLEEPQSFYKIHKLNRTWQDARKRCAMEGASLFYGEDKAEVDAVLQHWNRTTPEFAWLFVGISDLLSKGDFETIDGKPVHDVYNNWGPEEPNDANGEEDCVMLRKDGTLNDDRCFNKYPFICKKTYASLEWNLLCDMPDTSYVFEGELGKCYKFHINTMNWTDAVAVCQAEQSYLAILNSKKESEFLKKLTAESPRHKVKDNNYLNGVVYLGFHNRTGEGWLTLKGQPLAESGFPVWGGGQPDGSGGKEVCGSMFFNGELNDLNCDYRAFFICEHDLIEYTSDSAATVDSARSSAADGTNGTKTD